MFQKLEGEWLQCLEVELGICLSVALDGRDTQTVVCVIKVPENGALNILALKHGGIHRRRRRELDESIFAGIAGSGRKGREGTLESAIRLPRSGAIAASHGKYDSRQSH
jgi:hypothetical protein